MSDETLFPPEPRSRKRHPAGQALVVILVALVLGSLFNADRIDRTAHTQPYGWQRTWAIRITGPLRSISDTLMLNRVREELAESTGHGTGPPPVDTRTVTTVPPDVNTGSPNGETTTTTTVPVTYRTPTADDPLRIVVAGDSLMADIGGELSRQMADDPIVVAEDWKVSSGLVRPDYFNWPAHLEETMEENDPEVVIIGFGGNDSQGMSGPDGVLQLGSDEWMAEYQRRVAQVLDVLEDEGRTVYWVGLPAMNVEKIENTRLVINSVVQTELSARPWAHYIDTEPVLSPGGTYTSHLPDDDGKQVRVRQSDGVHAAVDGVRRITVPIVAAVSDERLDR